MVNGVKSLYKDYEANKKAMDEGKELLETDLERVKRLEDVNPLHHSEHNTEL